MIIKQPSCKYVLESVETWNTKILENAIYKKDVVLMIQSFVLLELSDPSSLKKEIPFEEIFKKKTPEDFLKLCPSLFIEFLFLMKKYRPILYDMKLAVLINQYKLILEEIQNDLSDNMDVLFMLNMINCLNSNYIIGKNLSEIKVSEDSFLLKSKVEIEQHLNRLLILATFSQKKIKLTRAIIEAIETVMIDVAIKYDLILVAKALRVLNYAEVKYSYTTELLYNFLIKNQSIEGYIGHYEAGFIKTNTQNIAQNRQLHVTKEITLAILEYKNNYRYMRDFLHVY